jgi:hypothetical protein
MITPKDIRFARRALYGDPVEFVDPPAHERREALQKLRDGALQPLAGKPYYFIGPEADKSLSALEVDWFRPVRDSELTALSLAMKRPTPKQFMKKRCRDSANEVVNRNRALRGRVEMASRA